MLKLRIQTKIEVLVGISLILLTLVISVASISRTITSDSDNIDTFIRNSNGNYWEATGANIQTAINDLNNNSGIVWLPGATTFTATSTIIVYENIELDMGGAVIQCSTDINVIELRENASICNGDIHTSGAFNDHAVIYIPSSPANYKNIKTRVVNNLRIYDDQTSPNGYGIHLNGTANDHCIYRVNIENVKMAWQKIGIYLESTGTAWVNGNTFNNIWIYNPYYCIKLENHGSEYIAGNRFSNIDIQTNAWCISVINISGNAYGNYFHGMVWDWNSAYDDDNSRVAIRLNGNRNYVDVFIGNLTMPQSGIIFDSGSGNIFINRVMVDNILQINKINVTSDLVIPNSIAASPSDGSMYFVTGNQSLAVYYSGKWYYYGHL